MNITTQNSPFVRAPQAQAPASKNVTLSGGDGFDFDDLKETMTWGSLGAVPAIGAVSNFTIFALTGIAHQKEASNAAFLGMGANVLGTGALITGLIIGNTATTMVGGGLLLASGVASGYAVNKNN